MSAASAVVVVIATIFLPPLGVFLIKGCGADLLINILLTVLGYIPGHIHAFYLEYVHYHRMEGRTGNPQGSYNTPQGQFVQQDQPGQATGVYR